MGKFFKFLISLSLLAFSLTMPAHAVTDSIEKLINYETLSNAASTRSNTLVKLPHVEIPLDLVGVDFAKRIDLKIADSLIFGLNNKKYVRWILNPEDTKWSDVLIAHFKEKHGLILERKYYFNGYMTASRSYIAEDPINGSQFSVKSSTNSTGGNWKDKKQPIGEAIDSRLMSDFLHSQNKLRQFQHFTFLDEPAILSVQDLDQAVVIRDLGELKKADSKFFYLPGFSALHETTGKLIAARNGSNDPYQFWTEHYVKVAGRALGELAARSGLQFDSPHSQNFLIELDLNMKPTGRLVLRDMADLYIDKNFFLALEGPDSPTISKFTQKENILKRLAAGFGPLHGNSYPSWISPENYSKWKDIFFADYERTFKDISGFDLKVLDVKAYQSGEYFTSSYDLTKSPNFASYFERLKAYGYIANMNSTVRCSIAVSATP